MLNNSSVEDHPKDEDCEEHRYHNDCCTVRRSHGKVGVLNPRQQDYIECKKKDGDGIGQDPREINEESHLVMWRLTRLRIWMTDF